MGASARVLLLAGEVRDAWSAAFAASGLEVCATGWLDGLTAARLERPDLVVVAADLPANAPKTVCTAFRSSDDLKDVPIAVVGLAPEVAEREWELPFRADRYVPAPVDHDALVREIHEALRVGRVPWRRRPHEVAVIALLVAAFAAMFVGTAVGDVLRWRGGTGLQPATRVALLVGGAVAFAAALGIAFAFRRRPFTPVERRSGLGWAGIWLVQAQAALPHEYAIWKMGLMSIGLLAWARWAWLGPTVKARSPRATRWLRLLGVLLVLLAAGPWMAWIVGRP